MKAGESAKEIVEKSLQKAKELEKKANDARQYADNFAKGAEGEMNLAKTLAVLSTQGYYITNDRVSIQNGGNIDHIVVGPGGVFILNAKNWSHKIVFNATLYAGKYSQEKSLTRALAEKAEMQSHLPNTPVYTALVFTGTGDIAKLPKAAKGCYFIALANIVSDIERTPAKLTSKEIEGAFTCILNNFPSTMQKVKILPPTIEEFNKKSKAERLPDETQLDDKYSVRIVTRKTENGTLKAYMRTKAGRELGWKDLSNNKIYLVKNHRNNIKFDNLIFQNLTAKIGFSEKARVCEIVTKFTSFLKSQYLDALIIEKEKLKGNEFLKVFILSAKEKPVYLGKINITYGLITPNSTELEKTHHKIPALHLLSYAWLTATK